MKFVRINILGGLRYIDFVPSHMENLLGVDEKTGQILAKITCTGLYIGSVCLKTFQTKNSRVIRTQWVWFKHYIPKCRTKTRIMAT